MVIDEQGVTQQAELEWARDSTIRAEFLSKDDYLAFKRAEAKGLVKMAAPRPTAKESALASALARKR